MCPKAKCPYRGKDFSPIRAHFVKNVQNSATLEVKQKTWGTKFGFLSRFSMKSNILMELESYYHQKISIKKIIWIWIFLRLQLKHTQAYLLNVMVWWSPTNYEAQNCTWLKVWVFKEKRFLKILLNFRFLSINVQSTYIWLKLTIDKKQIFDIIVFCSMFLSLLWENVHELIQSAVLNV